jgi:cobalt/nickel transport system permease protein
MLLEHAFGFSILEAAITALIFAYIQRTDASILYEKKSVKKMERTKEAAPA